MKKEFVIIGIFALILIGVGFVCATGIKIAQGEYQMNVKIHEGWNIIEGFHPNFLLPDSEITSGDITAVFMYAPDLNKYIEVYPTNKISESGINQNDEYYDDEAGAYSYWVYSKKDGNLKYQPHIIEPNNIAMKTGWNFLGINPEMKGKSLNELKGTCTYEKVNYFEASQQAWSPNYALNSRDKDEKMTDDALGLGVLIKVPSDCILSVSGSNSNLNPPQIPN